MTCRGRHRCGGSGADRDDAQAGTAFLACVLRRPTPSHQSRPIVASPAEAAQRSSSPLSAMKSPIWPQVTSWAGAGRPRFGPSHAKRIAQGCPTLPLAVVHVQPPSLTIPEDRAGRRAKGRQGSPGRGPHSPLLRLAACDGIVCCCWSHRDHAQRSDLERPDGLAAHRRRRASHATPSSARPCRASGRVLPAPALRAEAVADERTVWIRLRSSPSFARSRRTWSTVRAAIVS